MGAKHSRKSAKPDAAAAVSPTPVPATASPTPSSSTTAPAWIDSTDPRKRTFGKVMLAAVWLYVAALWLLALDQTFRWGIFGPKVP